MEYSVSSVRPTAVSSSISAWVGRKGEEEKGHLKVVREKRGIHKEEQWKLIALSKIYTAYIAVPCDKTYMYTTVRITHRHTKIIYHCYILKHTHVHVRQFINFSLPPESLHPSHQVIITLILETSAADGSRLHDHTLHMYITTLATRSHALLFDQDE